MPSVKNNFLKGRMNKDLDDRLVPQGEYRDAKNIRISKSDTEDAGVVQNIKGTTSKLNLGLADDYEVIGHFFSEARNEIIFFSTNNTSHRIDLYDIDQDSDYILATGNYLNFHKNNLITGINVIDDLLFFTDNRNQPRKLNIETAKREGSSYYNNDKLSVAKFAPYKALTMAMSNDSSITGEYIKERFVRFSYRLRYVDGEYSTLAPFTQIAFQMGDGTNDTDAGNRLTADEITKAYKSTILDKMVNGANKVVLTAEFPSSNPTTDYEIVEIDFLIKDSNSTAVRILETIDVTDSSGNQVEYTYKSSLPTKTLPPDQITRVSDKVPIRALAQEVAGNRIIYGNITENITFNNQAEISEGGKLPIIKYTVGYEPKNTIKDGETTANTDFDHLPHHSIKQRRTYQVGIVLADKYGRQSSVIISENSTVYVPAKDDAFDGSGDWVGDCLTITFEPYQSGTDNIINPDHIYNETTNPQGWYSYRFVIKQLEQEYYNVYVPGAQKYEDIGYITLHGDNINKIPQSATSSSTDTRLGASDTRLYPKVVNTSTFTFKGFNINADNTVDFTPHRLENTSYYPLTISNFTPPVHYYGEGSGPNTWDTEQPYATAALNNTIYVRNNALWPNNSNGEIPLSPATGQNLNTATAGGNTAGTGFTPTKAYLFIDGVPYDGAITITAQNNNLPSGSGSGVAHNIKLVTSTNPFATGVKWDLFLSYSFQIDNKGATGDDYDADFLSMTTPTVIGGTAAEKESALEKTAIGLKGEADDPASLSYDINEVFQKQSDGSLINVTGMGTLDLFENFREEDIESGSGVGFYQKDSKHVIASLSRTKADDSNPFQTLNTFSGSQLGGKAVDLAVFETEPRTSALDIFYEATTSDTVDGFLVDLNTESNTEFTCAEANVTGFAVAINGTITAPTAALGTIDSITYVGAAGNPASYATVLTNTVRTANVIITPPATGYSNSGGSNITCPVTVTQLANEPALNVDDTEAASVTHTGFTANADVKADGGDTITEKGFYFGTNNTTYNGSGNTKFTVSGASTGDYTRSFTSSDAGFAVNSTRYLWSFVTTDGPGNDQDGPVTVNIPATPTAPVGMSTDPIGTKTTTSIVLNGSFTSNGGSAITETGFYFGTNSSYASNTKYETNPEDLTSPFTITRSSLTAGTTYYITAYAINGVDESVGSTISATTNTTDTAPTVVSENASNITTTSFRANGSISSTGGAAITDKGFFIKQGSSSFTSSDKTSVGSGSLDFQLNKTGLNSNETWYYKAYATNSAGTGEGTVKSVTTSNNQGTRYLKFTVNASLASGTQVQGNTTVTLSYDYDDIGDPIPSTAFHQFGLTNGDPYSVASVNVGSISNSNFTAAKSFNDPYVKVTYSGNYPNIGPGATETVTVNVTTSNILQYDATVQFSGTISNSSFSNSPLNLTRTANEDTAFTAMTRTYTPNAGYHFENTADINVTLPSPNPDSIGVSKAMSSGNIVLTITGNVGQDDTTSTVTVSGNARANNATSVTVQYSTSSASGPWSSLTSGSNPGIAVDPSGVAYVKVTPNGAYTLSNGGPNASYVSIDDTSNTSGNAQVHTFTYGNNTTGSNKKINVNVLGGTTNLFTITSTLSSGT